MISRRIGPRLIVAFVLLAPVALAAPTPAEKETARRLVREGRTKVKAGDIRGALEDFKAAHEVMNVPATGLEVGRAQRRLGKLLEARDTFLSVQRMPPAKPDPPAFRKARALAKQLANELKRDIPTITVRIETDDDAPPPEVTVDGISAPVTGKEALLSVNPGKHTIVLKSGELKETRDVEVSKGENQTLEVLLRKPPPPSSADAEPRYYTSPLVYVGFTLAGAGLVTGAATGLMALSRRSELDEECVDSRCPPRTHGLIDGGEDLALVSTLGFAVGLVGAGLGVWGLTLSGEEETGAASTRFFVGLGGAGLKGSF